MAKYSFEFKMEVVQAYLNAEGVYRYFASKYNISAKRRGQKEASGYTNLTRTEKPQGF